VLKQIQSVARAVEELIRRQRDEGYVVEEEASDKTYLVLYRV
jgi:hypothetical protein